MNKPIIMFHIEDRVTVNTVIDTLRHHIIEIIIRQALTIKQNAAELRLTPRNPNFHSNLHESYQLIQEMETRWK